MTWLLPARVGKWLQLPDPLPADLLETVTDVCAAVEPLVERYRPDAFVPAVDPLDPPVYMPGPDVLQGATMYAARVFRRRNTPSGVEGFTEGAVYVANYDPDVQQFLHTGAYRPPQVG